MNNPNFQSIRRDPEFLINRSNALGYKFDVVHNYLDPQAKNANNFLNAVAPDYILYPKMEKFLAEYGLSDYEIHTWILYSRDDANLAIPFLITTAHNEQEVFTETHPFIAYIDLPEQKDQLYITVLQGFQMLIEAMVNDIGEGIYYFIVNGIRINLKIDSRGYGTYTTPRWQSTGNPEFYADLVTFLNENTFYL